MSIRPAPPPECTQAEHEDAVDTVVVGRARDLGGFSVRRVLPAASHPTIGPFIFFDHMGPAELPAGRGIDVRPHPHVCLATVTYLFDGQILHRDSLGYEQPIDPGAINWMTAGRGIVHSERTAPEERARDKRLHGIQIWVALPKEHEETEPAFTHHPAASLPQLQRDGVQLRVLAGSAFGATSPVTTFSPLFYVDALMPQGSVLEVPDEYSERALYIAEGEARVGAQRGSVGTLLVLTPRTPVRIHAETDARLLLIGGEPLGEARFIFWNFVASSRERIEQAKLDWKEQRFAKVPGDEDEFIPLPEG